MAFAFTFPSPHSQRPSQLYNKCQNWEIPGSITILLHCPRGHLTVRIKRPTSTPTTGKKQICASVERLPTSRWTVGPKKLINTIKNEYVSLCLCLNPSKKAAKMHVVLHKKIQVILKKGIKCKLTEKQQKEFYQNSQPITKPLLWIKATV